LIEDILSIHGMTCFSIVYFNYIIIVVKSLSYFTLMVDVTSLAFVCILEHDYKL